MILYQIKTIINSKKFKNENKNKINFCCIFVGVCSM